MSQYPRHRPSENKPHRANQPKDYEDEQDLYAPKFSDSPETKDLKARMRLLIGKLAASRKEKEAVTRQNETLQAQVLALQNNLRHMVAGFNNTTSDFPMSNELAAKIAEFYKYDCLDKFFDLLGPEELTLKGIIYFYLQSFQVAAALVEAHFQPALGKLRTVGCLETLEGPVLNVLRKAFQSRHHHIVLLIAREDVLERQAGQIIDALGISCVQRSQAVSQVSSFLGKLIQLLLQCKISDPPLLLQCSHIGKRVQFNSLNHDPFDGFIKNKEECFVILPQVRRREGELVTKALVLQKDYDLSC